MASLGELDRIVESLVGRGLVAPKFVGRQVGQALINELSNLPANIATSQATRASQDIKRQSDFARQVSSNRSGVGGSGAGGGLAAFAKDLSKPFATGVTKGNIGGPETVAVAIQGPKGIELESRQFTDPLAQLALQNAIGQLPQINTKYIGAGPIGSLQDVITELLRTSSNPEDVLRFFNR